MWLRDSELFLAQGEVVNVIEKLVDFAMWRALAALQYLLPKWIEFLALVVPFSEAGAFDELLAALESIVEVHVIVVGSIPPHNLRS